MSDVEELRTRLDGVAAATEAAMAATLFLDPEPTPPAAPERKYRHKVSFYQDEADTDRVRAAILHTMAIEGHARTLSEFIARAVMAEVERLEGQHNAGRPWTGVSARELPQGRPLGS